MVFSDDVSSFWIPDIELDPFTNFLDTPPTIESSETLPAPLNLEQTIKQEELDEIVSSTPITSAQVQTNGWMLNSMRDDVIVSNNDFLMIKVRSRGEDEAFNVLPECFYSSLRYQMIISIDSSVFTNMQPTLLMARATIVDENTQEVKNKKGESAIKGPKEYTTLDMNRENGRLECIIPVRFSSVSFHHSKRNFAFQVSFFDFVDNQMQILFDVKSTPFPTFARRPKVSERVAKVNTESSTVNTAICKKRKSENGKKSAALTRFLSHMEQLLILQDKLPEEEKILAIEQMSQILLKN
jgi:hypothetical protein